RQPGRNEQRHQLRHHPRRRRRRPPVLHRRHHRRQLTINGHLKGTTGVDLSKDGPGTLILTNDNSGFTGSITVVQGALNIQNAKALGDGSSPTTVLSTVGKTGQLQVQNVTGPINEVLRLNGPGPSNDGALLNVSGNNTWAGAIELDSDSTLGSNAGSLV